MPTRIASRDLSGGQVPAPAAVAEGADLGSVLAFAQTFNGYAWGGGPARMRDLVEDTRRAWEDDASMPSDVDHLRACLFWWARTRQHEADPVTRADREWLVALLTAIHAGLRRTD